ncbi:MAG TPA: DUF72 domain-containing protein, partial [Candidatus Hodarchaeales archaeon]|nr:DUF72 domain-containing protein [Candidatus Hodarchaeales archaeon]
MRIFWGTSGWQYDDWYGVFYPKEISKQKMFDYYARFYPAVEINSTFYRVPSEKTAFSWARKAPKGFRFTLKLHQSFTHDHFLKRNAQTEAEFENFSRVIEPLRKEWLGPILIQLPPKFSGQHIEALEPFLAMLPTKFRWVLEARNHSLVKEGAGRVQTLLEKYNTCFCITDSPLFPDDTCPAWQTTDIAYFRLHGRGQHLWYDYTYTQPQLEFWANRIKNIIVSETSLSEIYIFMNNHPNGQALGNMNSLAALLDLKFTPPIEKTNTSKTSSKTRPE